jgi:hypothetical protein
LRRPPPGVLDGQVVRQRDVADLPDSLRVGEVEVDERFSSGRRCQLEVDEGGATAAVRAVVVGLLG